VVWAVKADPDAYPPPLAARLLARADVVLLSAGERAFLARQGVAPRAGALVVETHGAGGVRWRRDGRAGAAPVVPLPVADTTGAGDAFAAGVIAGLAAGGGDEAAVRRGIETSRALLEARLADEREAE
jgi:sugar/nucleoside kinase (ribokinase family)